MVDRLTLMRRLGSGVVMNCGSARYKLWVARLFRRTPQRLMQLERLRWRLKLGLNARYRRPFGRLSRGVSE